MTAKVSGRVKTNPVQPGLFDRLLDPIDRLSETIFSVLIVLTFTLAYRVLRENAGQTAEYASGLFFGALGAAFAWGIIDGIMYALLSLFERGEKHRLLRDLSAAETAEEEVELIAGNSTTSSVLSPGTRSAAPCTPTSPSTCGTASRSPCASAVTTCGARSAPSWLR